MGRIANKLVENILLKLFTKQDIFDAIGISNLKRHVFVIKNV